MEENNNVQPPVVEETKKKSNKVAIIIACVFGGGALLVFLLPILFNIFIYKNVRQKVTDSTKESIKEMEETFEKAKKDVYTLEDLENYKWEENIIDYFNYKSLYKEFFEMDSKDDVAKAIDIDKDLVNYMKVDNGVLYLNYTGKWEKDNSIQGKILYLASDFNPESGSDSIIVVTESSIYILSSDVESTDSSSEDNSDWAIEYVKNIKHIEVKSPGKIEKFQVKYIYECEGVQIYQFMIDGNIYYLEYNYDRNNPQYKFVLASDYIEVFTDVYPGCSGAPEELLPDGTLNKVLDSNGNKINVLHYLILEDDLILIIDENNNIYSFNKGLFDKEETTKINSVGKIKAFKFHLDKEYLGNDYLEITFSDGKHFESHKIGSRFD